MLVYYIYILHTYIYIYVRSYTILAIYTDCVMRKIAETHHTKVLHPPSLYFLRDAPMLAEDACHFNTPLVLHLDRHESLSH